MAQIHELLHEKLDLLREIDPQTLVRSHELGQANFASALPVFQKTLGLFSQLEGLDYPALPEPAAKAIADQAESAINTFQEVAEFSLSQDNPTAARDNLVTRLEGEYARYYDVLSPHIAYLRGLATDEEYRHDALRQEANQLVEELRVLHQQSSEAIQQNRAEIESALESARKAAAEVGVGQQSDVFRLEALENHKQGRIWLLLTAVFGIAAFIFVLLAFQDVPASLSTQQLVRLSLQRALLFSLLAFAMGFSAKQYRAVRHNETVNRHRQNALRTFETFVSAAADQGVKDAVLLEATRSVFGAQPTGFLGSPGADSPSALVEVIQKASGSEVGS